LASAPQGNVPGRLGGDGPGRLGGNVPGRLGSDMPGRLGGDADTVRDAFEQMPVVLLALAGPDHRIVATNAAYRAFTGRSDVIGMSYQSLPRD